MRACWNRQTGKLEVLVSVRSCGFKSHRSHQQKETSEGMSLFAACGYSEVQGSPVKGSPARILPLPYLSLDEAGDGVRQPAHGGQSLHGCAVDTPGVRRFPVAA